MSHLLRPNMLQLPRRVHKVVGIRLGQDLPAVGLLHKVLIALVVGKLDGILLSCKVDVCALHDVSR